jgi:RNA polymerase sigma-70 factor (ECF subfamily)
LSRVLECRNLSLLDKLRDVRMSAEVTKQPARCFQTTRWSLVARAGDIDPSVRRNALRDLLTCYLPALRAHISFRLRKCPDAIEDYLHDFLTDKVLEAKLIPQARRERGKFRTFLLTALDRFVADRIAYDNAARRRPAGGTVPLGQAAGVASGSVDPSDAFHVAWARQVLDRAVADLRGRCAAEGRLDMWGVFEGRVLTPTLDGSEAEPYERLVERFSLRSAEAASNLLVTAKRAFARCLADAVGEYETDPERIDCEIAELRQILSRSRGKANGHGATAKRERS